MGALGLILNHLPRKAATTLSSPPKSFPLSPKQRPNSKMSAELYKSTALLYSARSVACTSPKGPMPPTHKGPRLASRTVALL